MKRFYLVGFLLLVLFDTFAQISFKMASINGGPLAYDTGWMLRVLGQPWIYGAFVGYIATFFIWMTLLRHAPVGPAFAASHIEIVSVLLLSAWLFDVPLSAPKLVGASLILAGIACLARGEATVAQQPP